MDVFQYINNKPAPFSELTVTQLFTTLYAPYGTCTFSTTFFLSSLLLVTTAQHRGHQTHSPQAICNLPVHFTQPSPSLHFSYKIWTSSESNHFLILNVFRHGL